MRPEHGLHAAAAGLAATTPTPQKLSWTSLWDTGMCSFVESVPPQRENLLCLEWPVQLCVHLLSFVAAELWVRCFLWNASFLSNAPHHRAPQMSFPVSFLTGSTGDYGAENIYITDKCITTSDSNGQNHTSRLFELHWAFQLNRMFLQIFHRKPHKILKVSVFVALKNWPSLSAKISEGYTHFGVVPRWKMLAGKFKDLSWHCESAACQYVLNSVLNAENLATDMYQEKLFIFHH